MPFRASISCAIFQRFSDALKHIIQARITQLWVATSSVTNYLDDFLFLVIAQALCNTMVDKFILLCKEINCPISLEKTECMSPLIIFLGILLDGL